MSNSHQSALRGTPLYEIGKTIQKADTKGKVIKTSPTIVKGLTPVKPKLEEGYFVLSPAQLASLLIPKQELTENSTISGFQRDVRRPHVRRIAESLEKGEPQPVIEVGLYRNALWVPEGQHRALGAIMANVPAPVVIRKMDADQMRKLFASQRKAMKVNPSILILSADDEYAEYVQDAVTASNPEQNPWFGMVTHVASSQKQLVPNQVYESIVRYIGSVVGGQVNQIIRTHEFEQKYADELATLFKAFGTKTTNPLAFRPVAIKAITYAAVFIIRRRGSKPEDIRRWKSHMSQFPWEQYVPIRQSKDLATQLIRHWNKKLHTENKVPLPEELA